VLRAAVVDKGRLQTRFNPGDDSLEYIAMGDLPAGVFDMKFFQMSIHDLGDPAFFRIDGVNQYVTHYKIPKLLAVIINP